MASLTPTQLLLVGLRPLPELWHPLLAVPLGTSILQLQKTEGQSVLQHLPPLTHIASSCWESALLRVSGPPGLEGQRSGNAD